MVSSKIDSSTCAYYWSGKQKWRPVSFLNGWHENLDISSSFIIMFEKQYSILLFYNDDAFATLNSSPLPWRPCLDVLFYYYYDSLQMIRSEQEGKQIYMEMYRPLGFILLGCAQLEKWNTRWHAAHHRSLLLHFFSPQLTSFPGLSASLMIGLFCIIKQFYE